MDRIGIFYGSTGGATSDAAHEIAGVLSSRGFEVDVMNIAYVTKDMLRRYERIIFGTSTWGMGVLQEDWDDIIDHLADIDFSNKQVALFGTGDQEIYPDTFVDGLGILFEKVTESNATVVGRWSRDGYKFRESRGLVDNKFVGLVLDEDNQHLHTSARIRDWVGQLASSFEHTSH